MSIRLASAPLLPVTTTFAAGILGAAWLGPRPLLLVALTGALLVLATVALGCGHDRPALLLLLGGLVALGALRGSAPLLPHDHISRLTLPPVVSIEGRLLDVVKPLPDPTPVGLATGLASPRIGPAAASDQP